MIRMGQKKPLHIKSLAKKNVKYNRLFPNVVLPVNLYYCFLGF